MKYSQIPSALKKSESEIYNGESNYNNIISIVYLAYDIQFPKINIVPLVNKSYVNKVTLIEQNPPLKCLSFDTVLKGFRSFNAKNLGL